MTEHSEQPNRSFLRKFSRLIPGWGLIDYLKSSDYRQDRGEGNPKRAIAHATYAGLTGAYLVLSWGFNSLNPAKWSDEVTRVNELAMQKIESEARVQQEHQRILNDLSNQLFGERGLADVNKDGRVDFNERMDAFDRAGCVSYGVGPVTIRQATTNDLQRAVDSYQPVRSAE